MPSPWATPHTGCELPPRNANVQVYQTRHKCKIPAHRCVGRELRTYVAPKVAVSAVWLVRKRKVLGLNDRFRPKRPKNGLCQGHTARTSVDNSTNEAFRNPGSLPRPCAHLFTKTLLIPFVAMMGLEHDDVAPLSQKTGAGCPPHSKLRSIVGPGTSIRRDSAQTR